MLFLPLYLSFHLNFLQRYPDSSHFPYFDPDSPHCYTDSPHSHSHLISWILLFIFWNSFILFSNSPFWLLQIVSSVFVV